MTERTRYIRQVRGLARKVAQLYLDQREKLGFPLLKQATEAAEEREEALQA